MTFGKQRKEGERGKVKRGRIERGKVSKNFTKSRKFCEKTPKDR
jgi:hypothetical protein